MSEDKSAEHTPEVLLEYGLLQQTAEELKAPERVKFHNLFNYYDTNR